MIPELIRTNCRGFMGEDNKFFPTITVKVKDLIPYARNSRTHSDDQVTQIASSIREFGFTNPIIVDEQNNIIAGHGRILAANKLKIKDVPCVVVTGWTEAQKKAYVIADNKLALNAGWDNEILRIEFDDLKEIGFDLLLTGFDNNEITNLSFGEVEEIDFPKLNDGDKEPFKQITFTLHDEQAEHVNTAISISKKMGAFVDTGNENSNGNALSRVCELFIGAHGNG